MVLRWFRERGCVHCLARDAGVSQATGYRYLHEAIDVLAAQAPDLHEVLNRWDGWDRVQQGQEQVTSCRLPPVSVTASGVP